MSHHERPKLFSADQVLEKGLHEDDSVQVIAGVVDMLKKYEKESFSTILQTTAVKLESEYSYREYEDLDQTAPKPDAITQSGREAVKMVARAFRKLDAKYSLLEKSAPSGERASVRQELIKELEMLRTAILEKRTEWLTDLLSDSSL